MFLPRDQATVPHVREHAARIWRVIAGQFWDGPSDLSQPWDLNDWFTASHALRMAASVDYVQADTGYLDVEGGSLYCGTAWDFEQAESSLASCYMTAVVRFNFVWGAYEFFVSETAGTRWPGHKTGFRARMLLNEIGRWVEAVPYFGSHLKDTLAAFAFAGGMDTELRRISPMLCGPKSIVAAELVRVLRNRLAHGDEGVPAPFDWGDGHEHDPESDPVVKRVVAGTRLLLFLIQGMAAKKLSDDGYWVASEDEKTGEEVWIGAADAVILAHLEREQDAGPQLALHLDGMSIGCFT